MAINQLSTSNTFQNWLTATTQLIAIANNITDGPSLSGNTLLILTKPGTSLNVTNTALINVLQSNTINTLSILVTGPGNSVNVSNSIWVGGNATVLGNITVGNITVTGTQTLGSVSFADITASGNASIGGWISTGKFIKQTGANSSFAGQVTFSNTVSNGIMATGNVVVDRTLYASNVTVSSRATVSTLNVTSSVVGPITFASNLTVQSTGITTLSGNVSITGNTDMGPYTETVVNLGTVNSNQSLNLRTGSFFRANLAASVTLTLINPPPVGRMASATIVMKQDAIGGRTVSLKANTINNTEGKIRYSYDVFPVIDTSANDTNILVLFTIDGGYNWYLSAPILSSNTN